MKPNPEGLTVMENSPIHEFVIKQALVALELTHTDESTLSYFDFLTKIIPTEAAYFVHVLPKLELYKSVTENGPIAPSIDFELSNDVLERIRGKIAQKISLYDEMYCKYEVREGDPLEELLNCAEDTDSDMVVIGQRTDVDEHEILSDNLARKSKGNALIVPEGAKPGISRILVPIDFSSNSIRALKSAIAISKRLEKRPEMICLNVYSMPNFSVYRISKTREQLKSMLEEDRQEAFEAFLHTHAGKDKDLIQTELIEKDLPGIGKYIYDYAEDTDVDLIVMGAKGHSKVELLLMGSVTEKVLTLNKKVPTLVIK